MTREANLHAIAHLYASDRNSLFIIPNHLELGDKFTRMASLSHTVIFHVGLDELLMSNELLCTPADVVPTQPNELSKFAPETPRERKWFMQESWMTRASEGRGLHMSRLWDYETGLHIASTIQDGLVRFSADAKLKL
jgi:acyl-CoA thioesterase